MAGSVEGPWGGADDSGRAATAAIVITGSTGLHGMRSVEVPIAFALASGGEESTEDEKDEGVEETDDDYDDEEEEKEDGEEDQ